MIRRRSYRRGLGLNRSVRSYHREWRTVAGDDALALIIAPAETNFSARAVALERAAARSSTATDRETLRATIGIVIAGISGAGRVGIADEAVRVFVDEIGGQCPSITGRRFNTGADTAIAVRRARVVLSSDIALAVRPCRDFPVTIRTLRPNDITDGIPRHAGTCGVGERAAVAVEQGYRVTGAIAYFLIHRRAFPAGIRRERSWGVQFHPEKSSTPGLRVIQNFLEEIR